MIVACILRSGGRFTPEWVGALAEGVSRYHPGTEFACLSDVPVPCPRIELNNEFLGWWSKMELFPSGLFTGHRVLYLDLDTVVVGGLDDLLAWDGHVAVLSDFYDPKNMASGVLMWDGDAMAHVWDAFSSNPKGIMRRHHRRMDHFLRPFLHCADRIQDLFPGQVVSYKADLRGKIRPYRKVTIPEEARLVCMHGKPYLTDLPEDDPVREEWGR